MAATTYTRYNLCMKKPKCAFCCGNIELRIVENSQNLESLKLGPPDMQTSLVEEMVLEGTVKVAFREVNASSLVL